VDWTTGKASTKSLPIHSRSRRIRRMCTRTGCASALQKRLNSSFAFALTACRFFYRQSSIVTINILAAVSSPVGSCEHRHPLGRMSSALREVADLRRGDRERQYGAQLPHTILPHPQHVLVRRAGPEHRAQIERTRRLARLALAGRRGEPSTSKMAPSAGCYPVLRSAKNAEISPRRASSNSASLSFASAITLVKSATDSIG